MLLFSAVLMLAAFNLSGPSLPTSHRAGALEEILAEESEELAFEEEDLIDVQEIVFEEENEGESDSGFESEE